MATKKKTTTTKTTKTARKPAARKSSAAPRACSVCSEKGHNKRSHAPGGRLAKGAKRAK